MNEYPKQMRWGRETVTVYAAPNKAGVVPIRYDDGVYGVERIGNLSPLPSPDEEVGVMVRLDRQQRDRLAEGWQADLVVGATRALTAACRAHRDAEEAGS